MRRNAILLVFLGLCFWGCSNTSPAHPIYVPLKCTIDMPTRPQDTQNVVLNNLSLLEYIIALETSLHYCRGDK